MKRIVFWAIFLVALPAFAGEPKEYQKAQLLDMGFQTQAITSYYNQGYATGNSHEAYGYGSSTPVTRRFKDYNFIVKLGDILYQTEYSAKYLWSYKPEWIVNDQVEVRVEKDKMFLRKPDGKDLKTSIVNRVRIPSPPVATANQPNPVESK